MSNNKLETTASLSFPAQDRIDLACDHFETAWKAGERPRIEDYLVQVSLLERDTLLRELLMLELYWRRRKGEHPAPQDYLARFHSNDDVAAIVAAFIRDSSAPPRFIRRELHERGGLGTVYRVHDVELNRVVALKSMRDDRACDPQSRARFVREAEITGLLEHPGIVPVYSLSRSDDAPPSYAMRLIRGETLKDAIKHFHAADARDRNLGHDSLALRGLLQRFISVCNTVEYAHSRGILHRDLKPENVMLGPFGETLVLDWGLAKPIGSWPESPDLGSLIASAPSINSSDTQAGSCVGTPCYMSPEQAAGEHNRLSPASDVYSLGCTLYHLLTGRPPFADQRDVTVILEKAKTGAFAPPRSIQRHLPRPLEAICLKAMATDPADRYLGARALADDLEHWLADEPISAAADSAWQHSTRWIRRHRATARAAVGAADRDYGRIDRRDVSNRSGAAP